MEAAAEAAAAAAVVVVAAAARVTSWMPLRAELSSRKSKADNPPPTKSQKSNAMMSELMQAMKTRRVIAVESDVSDSDSDGFN